MADIISRGEKPVPGIVYSEITIPDENDLGTGSFKTVLEPAALGKINPIVSSILNEPVFKLLVNINLSTESVTALLGTGGQSGPKSRRQFVLPKKFNVSDQHIFDVVFRSWNIEKLTMNGRNLRPSEE